MCWRLWSRFGQEVPQLGQGPQAPVVAEGASHAAAVREFEVDKVGAAVLDRIEAVLVPHVIEVVDFARLLQGLLGVGPSVGVEKKTGEGNDVFTQREI